MATKKTPTTEAEVKVEAVAVEAPAATEPAEAPKKKTTVKKAATAKKTTTKKAADEKKPAAKKTAKADAQANIFIQYQGIELSYSDLVARVKAESGVKSPKSVNIYVKPEENMVYYVVDGKDGGFQLA